ncbi:MAG: HDIG domain-containing metalloprotein [Spirochaetota bacterium]
MDREEAYNLLTQYTKKSGLIKHALAVEACMREYARKLNQDEQTWGIVGLVHDFDYEKHPNTQEHPYKGAEILRQKGVPEEWVQAILAHADYTGVKRESLMSRVLYACDELTGFVVAVALVRPSKKLEDVSVKSVKKKMKDKAFAAAVDRESIRKGAEELGLSLDEHISVVLQAMKGISDQLGL